MGDPKYTNFTPMPHCYIIAGPNGAGKTTASMTILPETLHCKEFVNADSIAAGLSPLDPDSMAIKAGRLMLERIGQLSEDGSDFAFETTLSTRTYVQFIHTARQKGYMITLLFFWLSSPEFAKSRVAERVRNGGHNIPADAIERRFYRGIANLCRLYMPVCDDWAILNNMSNEPQIVAVGGKQVDGLVANRDIYNSILDQSKHDEQ
jgi:predicted ABC-type ATPase